MARKNAGPLQPNQMVWLNELVAGNLRPGRGPVQSETSFSIGFGH